MSKNKTIFIIGLIVLIMPFLGFPTGFKDIVYMLAGAGLIVLPISNRISRGTVGAPAEKAETGIFAEGSPNPQHKDMS